VSTKAIGVDIGATRTKMVVLADSGEVLDSRELASNFRSPKAVVAAVAAAIADWAGDGEGARAAAIGLAVPGLVERSTGTVLRAPNLLALEGFGIGPALVAATGLPVSLDNDANAAGLAEAVLGAAAGCEAAVCLTVGTGVGGAIIHGGRLWRGPGGLAGELGRLILDPEGRVHFEEQVGAAAVVAAYARRAGAPAGDIDAERVGERAAAGDRAAREALAECGRHLGVGLAILMNLLNPQRIVIGGGVASAGEWLLEPAREEAARRAWREAWAQCEVVPGRLGARAGAIGAALSCWHD
jgi:glucokinase